MALNVYEGMFILDSNRYARDPAGVSGDIPKMVENLDGEILADRLWNEQRLAYPIKGHRKGTYWLSYFRMESAKLVELTRACKLNDNVVRSLVLKVDPRLVDTLVEHALGKVKAAPDEKPQTKAADDKAAAPDKQNAEPKSDVATEEVPATAQQAVEPAPEEAPKAENTPEE